MAAKSMDYLKGIRIKKTKFAKRAFGDYAKHIRPFTKRLVAKAERAGSKNMIRKEIS